MVTGHFGLDEGPFHGKAEGEDVYLGTQQAAVVARLKKALSVPDAAIAVSGPVGVGKTTLVRHAVAAVTGRKILVPVDRMRLEPDEVLDLLLVRFDLSRQPKGTVQRVAAFRRLLQEQLGTDTRVFIVVEDAQRVGIDALLELEALTANDSGDSAGANLVLMGTEDLPSLLANPALARLRQRIRLRQEVTPFTAEDVAGYMRHCLDAAGGVFEQIFEHGAAEIVYRYSGGVARVVDNLCESALATAAEANVATILPEFLVEVADNCGLEPLAADESSQPADPPPVAAPDECTTTDACDVAGDVDVAEIPEPTSTQPELPKLSLVEPWPNFDGSRSDDALTLSRIDQVLPELIERLQASAAAPKRSPGAEKEIADPESVTMSEPAVDDCAVPDAGAADELAEPAANAEFADDIPTLSNSMRVAVLPVRIAGEPCLQGVDMAETVDGDANPREGDGPATMPDPSDGPPDAGNESEAGQPAVWEEPSAADADGLSGIRPQCVTQLRPDAQPALDRQEGPRTVPDMRRGSDPGSGADGSDDVYIDPDMTAEAEALSLEDNPELAAAVSLVAADLDAPVDDEPELDALQAAIQAANAWQAGDAEVDDVNAAPCAPETVPSDPPEITLDLPTPETNTLSDDRERWADELSKAKNLEDISDMLAETLFGNEELQNIGEEIRVNNAAAAGDAAKPAEPSPAPASLQAPPVFVTTPSVQDAAIRNMHAGPAAASGINMTMSQRIQMVHSLNRSAPPKRPPTSHIAEIVLGESPDMPARLAGGGPEPIEAQIDTAITQSRQALSEAELARLAAGDEDEGKGSKGLFGLFRRSSKT